mmetsp:Transcript_31364/g.103837  ORF Transcript_31364/g.103837 Transcript_31364/m.103837 type:complete len:284 (-) Transcript_31364:237-1088(-)
MPSWWGRRRRGLPLGPSLWRRAAAPRLRPTGSIWAAQTRPPQSLPCRRPHRRPDQSSRPAGRQQPATPGRTSDSPRRLTRPPRSASRRSARETERGRGTHLAGRGVRPGRRCPAPCPPRRHRQGGERAAEASLRPAPLRPAVPLPAVPAAAPARRRRSLTPRRSLSLRSGGGPRRTRLLPLRPPRRPSEGGVRTGSASPTLRWRSKRRSLSWRTSPSTCPTGQALATRPARRTRTSPTRTTPRWRAAASAAALPRPSGPGSARRRGRAAQRSVARAAAAVAAW